MNGMDLMGFMALISAATTAAIILATVALGVFAFAVLADVSSIRR